MKFIQKYIYLIYVKVVKYPLNISSHARTHTCAHTRMSKGT